MICRALQRINIVSGFVKTFNTPVSFLWLIAAAWIVFYPGNALSADWVRTSNHQNGDAAYLDMDSVVRDRSGATHAWSLVDLNKPFKGRWLSVQMHRRYDCDRDTYLTSIVISHLKQMGRDRGFERSSQPTNWSQVSSALDRKTQELVCATADRYVGRWDHAQTMYRKGSSSYAAKDYKKALDYFKKAAALKTFPRALNRVGNMYKEGRGVPPNYRIAFNQYSLGAQAADEFSFVSLGLAHYLGQGTAKNPVLAYMWFSIAAAGPKDAITSKSAVKLLKIMDRKTQLAQKNKARKLAGSCVRRRFRNCDKVP